MPADVYHHQPDHLTYGYINIRPPPQYIVLPPPSQLRHAGSHTTMRPTGQNQTPPKPPPKTNHVVTVPPRSHPPLTRAISSPMLHSSAQRAIAAHRKQVSAQEQSYTSLRGRDTAARKEKQNVPFPSVKHTRDRSNSQKNKVPLPKEAVVDFGSIWRRFVRASLDSSDEAERIRLEKAQHPLGKVSAEYSPFHALPLLDKPTRHQLSVVFNPQSEHLAKWRRHCDLEGVQPREEYMEELFSRTVDALEKSYGWLRQHPTSKSSARHYILRPGIPPPSAAIPAHPHPTKIDMLFLPGSTKAFLGRDGERWKGSIRQQLQSVRAHRHPTMGLVFHSWMNNHDDVTANVDAVPPPIWFLLYAMQAAHPGMIVIREEMENDLVHRVLERGLPPYDILTDRGCGPFFLGLLGEQGYTATCEAALDARTSTSVDVMIKGSVRPRRRADSAGLPLDEPAVPEAKLATSLQEPPLNFNPIEI
ncbi:hypothetical protein FRB99_004101 [Tulasnella sp. 403]|nr:hypothetical protein FRB99_004101 [Tulasnella sp. 403]